MKKNNKKFALVMLAGALAVGGAFTGYAANLGGGQWCTGTGAEAGKYWFAVAQDGSKFIANTWHWVKDKDGNVYCYYFDQNGWVVTNTTIDGAQVDENGRWVQNGQPVKASSEAEKDFYTHSDTFLSSVKAELESEQKAADTTQNNNTEAGTKTGAATGTTTGKKTNVIKGSGKGDDPASAQADAIGYTISTVSGMSVTNDWANFKMNLTSAGGTIEVGTPETGMDFYVNNGAELTARFIPIDKYKSGNTDLNAFITSFIADVKERVKGAKLTDDAQLGDYTFKQITYAEPNPNLSVTNRVYFRVVDGTNYAQVISVRQNGEAEKFASALQTIQKVHE